MVAVSVSSRLGYFSSSVLAVAMLVVFIGPFWWPGESSSWAAFIRAALVVVLIFSLPSLSWRAVSPPPLFWTILLLFAYLVVNSLTASDSMKSFRRLLLIAVFFWAVGYMGLDRRFDWKRVLQIAVVLVAGFAAFSMLNLAANGAFILGYREMSLSGSGVAEVADFGNTIVAGMNYGVFMLASLWLMLLSRRRPEFFVWLLCFGLIATYVYFTFARTAWVATAVGGFVLLCAMTSGKVRRNLLLILLAIVALVLFFGLSELAYEIQTRGVTGRTEVWHAVVERLAGDWWFGVGAGTPLGEVQLKSGQIVHNTHGLYFEVLYQFGVVGIVLLWMAMIHSGWILLRARTTSEIAALWLALLCGGGIIMTVELHTFVGSPGLIWEWLLLPMAGALKVSREVRRAQG